MNEINNEPISSQLVKLSNVKKDSTEQFNTLGYPFFSSNWIYLICLQFKWMLTDVLKSLKLAYKPRQIKKPSLKITHKLKNMVTFVYQSKVVIRDNE